MDDSFYTQCRPGSFALAASERAPLLEVRSLSLRFGGIEAPAGAGFTIMPGEIVSLIGPNSAGKTSLFNCISGTHRPTAGVTWFHGADITALPSARRAGRGIGRTFQNLALFGHMSVLENILVGRHRLMRGNLPPNWRRTRRSSDPTLVSVRRRSRPPPPDDGHEMPTTGQ